MFKTPILILSPGNNLVFYCSIMAENQQKRYCWAE